MAFSALEPTRQQPSQVRPSDTTSISDETMASIVRPQLKFFLSRDNSTYVPLVPADELPPNIHLQGVPRHMSWEQTRVLSWVGVEGYTGDYFQLDNVISAPQLQDVGDEQQQLSQEDLACYDPRKDHGGSSSPPPDSTAGEMYTEAALISPKAQHASPAPIVRLPSGDVYMENCHVNDSFETVHASSHEHAALDDMNGSSSGTQLVDPIHRGTTPELPLPPSGQHPDPTQKVFCTYWIRHGYCDYKQQGCAFKHEIPGRSTLDEIGVEFTFLDKPWKLSGTWRGGRHQHQDHHQYQQHHQQSTNAGPSTRSRDWRRGARRNSRSSRAEAGEQGRPQERTVREGKRPMRLEGETTVQTTQSRGPAAVAARLISVSPVADLITFEQEPLVPTRRASLSPSIRPSESSTRRREPTSPQDLRSAGRKRRSSTQMLQSSSPSHLRHVPDSSGNVYRQRGRAALRRQARFAHRQQASPLDYGGSREDRELLVINKRGT